MSAIDAAVAAALARGADELRMRYVDAETFAQLLEACPNAIITNWGSEQLATGILRGVVVSARHKPGAK